jgi:hypothetical protein
VGGLLLPLDARLGIEDKQAYRTSGEHLALDKSVRLFGHEQCASIG